MSKELVVVFLALIAIGLVVGLVSSIFGVGGGTIIIPALFSLFPELPPQTVIGCSLLLIFFNSLINIQNFWRFGLRPNWRVLAPIAIFAAVGAVVGGGLTEYLEKSTIKSIFAGVVAWVALQFLWKGSSPEEQREFVANHYKGSVTGLAGGLVAGLTGLGGGGVMAPLLIKLLKIPLRRVPLYSNYVMAAATLTGCLSLLSAETPAIAYPRFRSFQFGHLNLAIPLLIVPGALATSSLGIWIAQKLPLRVLEYLFACFLLAIASKTFWY